MGILRVVYPACFLCSSLSETVVGYIHLMLSNETKYLFWKAGRTGVCHICSKSAGVLEFALIKFS